MIAKKRTPTWITQQLLILSLLIGSSLLSAQDPVPDHETLKIESKVLDETRVICIWKPPGYEKTDAKYPVLYMPDGGVKEDFPHIANTISELIAGGEIAPCLVVGIENTQRRRDLTGPSKIKSDADIAPITDGSSKFRKFFQDELFPAIEQRYRVNKNRAIVGESAAGLFVVETLFLKPDMFDIYVAMDPAIYWNDRYLVRTAPEHLNSLKEKEIRLWFTAADTPGITTNVKELATILETKAPKTLNWKYLPQPDEKHNTIFRATKVEAFKWALWPAGKDD